jgi:hypothetical protein
MEEIGEDCEPCVKASDSEGPVDESIQSGSSRGMDREAIAFELEQCRDACFFQRNLAHDWL